MIANTLYFGDNLQVLREEFGDASVDLVYLDPPFNSNRDYNIIYRDVAGTGDTAQQQAFSDTWTMEGAAADFREVTLSGFPEGKLIDTLREVYGNTSLVAYLSVMALRLRELHRVLKPTGSLYLHCDPAASHYLKMVLDGVFGQGGFRTEVVWKRSSAHSDAKQGRRQHGRLHDVVLFYSKSDRWTWNWVYTPYDPEYVQTFYSNIEPETGRRFQYGDLTGPGGAAKGNPSYEFLGVTRFWRYTREKMEQLYREGRIVFRPGGTVPRQKRYLDEARGVPIQDMWTDIRPLVNFGNEALGFQTQKPLALLERIVTASSNPGDLVLDPCCGCGTAVVAAQKLGRQWCGIDITSLAVNLIRERLSDHFPEVYPTPASVPVAGLPKDEHAARDLFASSPYDFQFWALTLVGAHPPGGARKRGADRGVDGEILWRDGENKLQKAVVQIKGGQTVNDGMLRDLLETMRAENAEMALFLSLASPSAPMRNRAALAGDYELAGTTARFPRLQLLTVGELLAGRTAALPLASRIEAHREAPVIPEAGQQELDFDAE